MKITIARIYDAPNIEGYRVLVDRLWPRGVSKQRAALDLWAKDIAPSPGLRTWFGHKPERFAEFTARYTAELEENPAFKTFIADIRQHGTVVLLYAAHDPEVNHAVVLRDYLLRKIGD